MNESDVKTKIIAFTFPSSLMDQDQHFYIHDLYMQQPVEVALHFYVCFLSCFYLEQNKIYSLHELSYLNVRNCSNDIFIINQDQQ